MSEQTILAVTIPSVTVLIGILINNHRINDMNQHLTAMETTSYLAAYVADFIVGEGVHREALEGGASFGCASYAYRAGTEAPLNFRLLGRRF